MRTLHLLRHAAADTGLGRDDIERPLSAEGTADARRLGRHLEGRGFAPQLVRCSPAARTRATLDALGSALPRDCPVDIDDALYGATTDGLLEAVRGLPDDATAVLMVTHNPAAQQLTALLADSLDDRPGLARHFPPGGLVTLRTQADTWADAAPGTFRLGDFVGPQQLRSGS